MKHEWKKAEKEYYLPKVKPEQITIPEFKFFTIKGEGNPNDESFGEYISVLYSLSYAIRMSPKKNIEPEGYFEYTVYPLEGVWDINEEAKKHYDGVLDKDTLVFTLMIRQPDFVTEEFAEKIINITKSKKPHVLLDQVKFQKINEGKCIQMLHIGSYDNEPLSFREMEVFSEENNLRRSCKIHREIYLSDARKVESAKLKTVLRFQVDSR